ncbi:MAG: ATP-binding protein, partial [Lachnospiraceae bacterium]|nr:ATP-binding protein [Lachnospiraceae bacterium]
IASIHIHYLVKLEGHELLRGDAYILMYLFSAYYLIFVFVRMIRHFHHLSKRQSRSVIVFVSVTFVGALLQLLVFGDQMLIYFIYAISCLTLLFAFETPDYQKMIKATEELRLNKEKLEESEANLQQALFTAQEASMAKTTFLSNMSHDIRTPMNAIIGYTELAKEHISDKDEVLDCLNTIKSSGDHLLSLINDVLDMSRIESGKMKVELSPCNLSEMINDIELLTKANVDEKNQTYKTIIDSLSHPYVMCDRLRLNQVLINCIGNAVKYTMEGGHIEVSLTERNSAIEGSKEYIFKVTDNGIGMSDEFLKHVFEPFERAKDSTASSIQGTGLGMAITQNLTQMMGGSITVESELGQGSTFIITLPLTVISAEEYTSSKDTVDDNTSLDDKTKALSGKRVLVVDDNKINRTVVKRLLGERGLLIDECDCGEKAIEIVSNMTTNMYDVIFMDIKMPTMDGYETTDAIRNLDSDIAKTIPIIAMTANAFEEDKNMAMSHGMNGHVTKPFKIEELITFLYTKLCSD